MGARTVPISALSGSVDKSLASSSEAVVCSKVQDKKTVKKVEANIF